VIKKLHHVGIAVVDLDESIRLYGKLGAALVHRSTNEKDGLEAAFLKVGDEELELMSPLREDSPVGKFLAKRGPGVHHIAYAVADIREAIAAAKKAGLEVVDEEPRKGIHGGLIAFVHPKSVGGVLTEFVEL
jgi:methylmalonyl-CoA epimerase